MHPITASQDITLGPQLHKFKQPSPQWSESHAGNEAIDFEGNIFNIAVSRVHVDGLKPCTEFNRSFIQNERIV